MANWLLYHATYDKDIARGKSYPYGWYSNSQYLYNNVREGDVLWSVVRKRLRKASSWHLSGKMVVHKKKKLPRRSPWGWYFFEPRRNDNEYTVVDHPPNIENLLRTLEMASGKAITFRSGLIGLQIQTPRLLTKRDSSALEKFSRNLKVAT
jgi:hypothetical protein